MSVLTHDEWRRLDSNELDGYGPAPFPDHRDVLLGAIIDRLTNRERYEQTSTNLRPGHRAAFGCFARRGAALAVRTQDAVMVRRAILAAALGLGTATGDKDALLQVPLPPRAAELLGLDPVTVVEDLADLIDASAHAHLLQYAGSGDLAGYVGRMGYEETGSGPTFDFTFTAW